MAWRVLLFELCWMLANCQQALDKLQSAMGSLVTAADPDAQLVRQYADKRYVAYTAGAPDDFAFKRAEGESITELLASTDPESFKLFCEWHREHFTALKQTIRSSRGLLREQVAKDVGRLVDIGFLFSIAQSRFDSVTSSEPLSAIDSFDGALLDGVFSRSTGIALSHRFDDGYAIGKPTQRFFQCGLHEFMHAVHAYYGSAIGAIPIMEEVLIEHAVAVASDPNLNPEDMAAAAKNGSYNSERKLFAAVAGPASGFFGLDLPRATRMLASRDVTTMTWLAQQVPRNFAKVFPEHGDAAWDVFLQGYNQAHTVRKSEYAGFWAEQAIERTS